MNFQALAVAQGSHFEEHCRFILETMGYTCSPKLRLPEIGVEVDIPLIGPHGEFLVECKGSWQGTRPGLLRSDTVKKAIANGALIQASRLLRGQTYPPYVVLTSHLPETGAAAAMLDVALEDGMVMAALAVHDRVGLKNLFG